MSFQDTSITLPESTRRVLFALIAPTPTEEAIKIEYERDHRQNPYNDNHLPKKRNTNEIIADLRLRFADTMIERMKVQK